MPSVNRRYAPTELRFKRPPAARGDESRAPVVLMVSGGADSTALVVLAATSPLDIDDGRGAQRIMRERLHILHVNHQLRGIDAEEDEEFVRQLASRFGMPCTVHRADVRALAEEAARRTGSSDDANVENVGREVRYEAARKLANDLCDQLGAPRSAARIVTAHTADDRAETFFMNAIRGTGPAGLSSIPRRRNRIVRPLLDYTHEELCDLLRMRGIIWREDVTNKDTHYLRAYVRHEVMPVVRKRNARVAGSIATTCDILSDEDAYMNQVASKTYRELIRRSSDSMVALDAHRLAACEVAIARRVVRKAIVDICPDARLEARHIARALELVAADHGSASIPLGADVRVEYGLLFIRAHGSSRRELALWLEVPGRVALPDGRALSARLVSLPAGASAPDVARAHALEFKGSSVLLDAEACGLSRSQGGRLWVDAAAPGDVMCPLGMHGQSKKLSDVLNEAKVPAADRPGVPIVRLDATGPVAWVAGIRPDERVRCASDTKLLLELGIIDG